MLKRPTQRRQGQKDSKLDLIFTDEASMVDLITNAAPVVKSDHDNLLCIYLCCKFATAICYREGLIYCKGQFLCSFQA